MKPSHLIISGMILSLLMGVFSYFHFKEQRQKAFLIAQQQAEIEKQERIKKVENIICNQMFKGERSSEIKCLEIRVYRIERDIVHNYWFFWLEMKGLRNGIVYELTGRATDTDGFGFQFMEDNVEE